MSVMLNLLTIHVKHAEAAVTANGPIRVHLRLTHDALHGLLLHNRCLTQKGTQFQRRREKMKRHWD